MLSFKEVIDNIKNDKYDLLFYEDVKDYTKTLKVLEEMKMDKPKGFNVNVIIGPEGGFAKEEIAYAENNNIYILSLGKRILRVETATLTALSYINYVLEG